MQCRWLFCRRKVAEDRAYHSIPSLIQVCNARRYTSRHIFAKLTQCLGTETILVHIYMIFMKQSGRCSHFIKTATTK